MRTSCGGDRSAIEGVGQPVTMYTLGIEGGPLDGGVATVEADDDGRPPYRQCWSGAVYVREPFGLEPHDPHWHYCHRGPVPVRPRAAVQF